MTPQEELDFVKWAKRALAGLEGKSDVMLGLWTDHSDRARYEFMLQVGHCLCEGKPLLLVVADGMAVPAKLLAAASYIEYYIPNNQESMMAATHRVLERFDPEMVPKH
jgi:hypothetical protein